MPIVVRHAISGIADINSEDPLFRRSGRPGHADRLFSERGFHAMVDVTRVGVPTADRSPDRANLLPREEGFPFQHPLQKSGNPQLVREAYLRLPHRGFFRSLPAWWPRAKLIV